MSTLEQIETGHAAVDFVMQIEGFGYIVTSGDAAAALAAWQSAGKPGHSDIVGAVSGLSVSWSQDQVADPWRPFVEPAIVRLTIVPGVNHDGDVSDVVGRSLFKRSGGVETTLVSALSPTATTVSVRSAAGFASAGVVHIGPEAVGYATNNSPVVEELDDLTRGLYSPLHTESDGRYYRTHWVRNTSLTSAPPYTIDLPVIVSDEPRRWQGRWVSLWLCARRGDVVDGPDDAHRAFAGVIAQIDQGQHGEIVIELESAARRIAETQLMGDPFQAKLAEGVYLSAATAGAFECQTQRLTTSAVIDDADPLVIVVGTPASANEIQEGRYTVNELGQAIAAWLQAEYAAGRIAFSVGYDATYDTGTGTRGVLSYADPVSGSASRVVRLSFPSEQVSRYLGWDGSDASLSSGERDDYKRSPRPPLRVSLWDASGTWRLVEPRGTWIDQSSLLPPSVRDPAGLAQGVLRIGDRGHAVVRRTSDTLFSNAFDSRELNRYLAQLAFEAESEITYDDAPDVSVSQVIVAEAPFGELLLKILLSTGGLNHNHSTYDTLPETFACRIPYEVFGADFETDVAQLSGVNDTLSVIVSKPTRFVDVFSADLLLRWCCLVWGNGRLRLQAWGTPTAASAVYDLGEADKATPAALASSDSQRPRASESEALLRNVVTIHYGRDQAGDLVNELYFADRDSLAAYGERPVKIEARNTLGSSAIGDLQGTLSRWAATWPLFSRPVLIVERTVSLPWFERLVPLTHVTLTDRGIRSPETGALYDPATGEGGLQGWPGIVVSNRHSWGGARPGLGGPPPAPDQALGEVAIMLFDRVDGAAYSPAAEVDSTASSGGFSAGYSSGALTLRTLPHAYSESFDPADASRFVAGDEVRILEIDPDGPSTPTTWQRTIASVSGNDLVLTSALSSPAWDAAKRYRVVPASYTATAATQRSTVYQAHYTSGLVSSTRAPWGLVVSGRGQNANGVFTTAAPTELPARYAAIEHNDGSPLDAGAAANLARLVNNLVSYKTAQQSANLYGDAMGGVSAGYELLEMRLIFVGVGVLSGNQTVRLEVAPMFRSKTGASVTVRVTLARFRPQGDSRVDVERVAPYVDATWTTTSTTAVIGADTELDTRHLERAAGPDGGWAWLYVESTSDAEYSGLARCALGPVEAP